VELRDKTIVFPSTQARILTVHVNVGDEVKEGDLLITYDDEIIETMQDQLAQARLALRSAELGLAATRIGATDTEILAANNQIEQARAGIANIESQLDQMDLQITQAEENIATAKNNLSNAQFLYENGVIPRKDLDDATEAIRGLQDRLAVLQSQRDTAALGLPTAQDAERFAVAQRDAVLNRNRQPAALNQAQLQQIAIEQAELNIAQIERNIADFKHEEFAAVSGTILRIAAKTT
jgi:multidrug resistance efflux pump